MAHFATNRRQGYGSVCVAQAAYCSLYTVERFSLLALPCRGKPDWRCSLAIALDHAVPGVLNAI